MSAVATVLTPPDYNHCQCTITPAHGPFRLGPRGQPRECGKPPAWIAVEIVPGADGKCGAMSLCNECAKILLDDPDLRKRVQLQPILKEEA